MQDTLTPLRMFIVFLGLLLPTLALIPIGSLWLWQHGYLIHWAVAKRSHAPLIAYAFERLTLGRPSPAPGIRPRHRSISMAKDGEISAGGHVTRTGGGGRRGAGQRSLIAGHRILERFAEHRARNR